MISPEAQDVEDQAENRSIIRNPRTHSAPVADRKWTDELRIGQNEISAHAQVTRAPVGRLFDEIQLTVNGKPGRALCAAIGDRLGASKTPPASELL
jgi:hypothetical protein